ncbi:hypothetical protein MCEMSE15_00627 [Fimbriimonadaceae bacterium]
MYDCFTKEQLPLNVTPSFLHLKCTEIWNGFLFRGKPGRIVRDIGPEFQDTKLPDDVEALLVQP